MAELVGTRAGCSHTTQSVWNLPHDNAFGLKCAVAPKDCRAMGEGDPVRRSKRFCWPPPTVCENAFGCSVKVHRVTEWFVWLRGNESLHSAYWNVTKHRTLKYPEGSFSDLINLRYSVVGSISRCLLSSKVWKDFMGHKRNLTLSICLMFCMSISVVSPPIFLRTIFHNLFFEQKIFFFFQKKWNCCAMAHFITNEHDSNRMNKTNDN